MPMVDVEVTSRQPMLQHSPRGLDINDPLVRAWKKIHAKGTKTEQDLLEMDWLEFQCALYWNGSCVYVPDTAIVATIQGGAKHHKRGLLVKAGVDVDGMDVPLIYKGPQTPRELYEANYVDRRPVSIQKSKIIRVRPRFNEWALRFRLIIDDRIISLPHAREALEVGGQRVALLDYRPRFGRFEVTLWKLVVE